MLLRFGCKDSIAEDFYWFGGRRWPHFRAQLFRAWSVYGGQSMLGAMSNQLLLVSEFRVR